jgi:adenylate cyclase
LVCPDGPERKLAAILSADVVGYSRLMAEDEGATIRTLTDYREAISMLVRQHRGRVVDSPGDNLLAEFPTALDAVQAAVEIQRVIGARNADLAPERRMEFRIGVHLGDIAIEGERVFGDGVNVAARLEGLAQPGGVCISDVVYNQVEKKLPVELEDLGEQTLKNIPRPVHVYGVKFLLPEAQNRALQTAPHEIGSLTVPSFGGRPAIAVLPFDNLSGDPDQEYFADGIAEDLITRLSAWREFPVIARNSSFVYKGKAIDVKRVSHELGVRYVVEGSVRKAGNRVRVSAQLIDAPAGSHVWAERYDRELQDIFALQDEITEAVVASIFPEVGRAEMERAVRKEPGSLDAWDCVLRGSWHLEKFTREDNVEAQSLFGRAVALDPSSASAFAGLAVTHLSEATYGWTDSPERSIEEANRLVRKSLELDSREPRGTLAMAHCLGVGGQRDQMIAVLQRLIELNPNSASSYGQLGFVLSYAGRPDDAITNLERAMRLSPRDHSMHMWLVGMGWAHFAMGRYEAAASWLERCRQTRPDYHLAHRALAATYAQLGRLEEARRALQEDLRLVAEESVSVIMAQIPYADPAFLEKYLAALRKAGLKEE